MKALCILSLVLIATALHIPSTEHLLQLDHEALLLRHDQNRNQYPTANQAPNQYPTPAQFLARYPKGPTVDLKSAYELRDFFGTAMGHTILRYMDDRSVQPDKSRGLNRFKLSDANFRLWMAIKIISNQDANMYARSLTLDSSLYNEYIRRRY